MKRFANSQLELQFETFDEVAITPRGIELARLRPDFESGVGHYDPQPYFTLPRGQVNRKHCLVVRIILRIVRAWTEGELDEIRFTPLSLAIDRFNGPVMYGGARP